MADTKHTITPHALDDDFSSSDNKKKFSVFQSCRIGSLSFMSNIFLIFNRRHTAQKQRSTKKKKLNHPPGILHTENVPIRDRLIRLWQKKCDNFRVLESCPSPRNTCFFYFSRRNGTSGKYASLHKAEDSMERGVTDKENESFHSASGKVGCGGTFLSCPLFSFQEF